MSELQLVIQGQPNNVYVEGGAAVLVVDIRPPPGHIWQISFLDMWQDDAVAHRCGFYSYDGATQTCLTENAALAAAAHLPLYSANLPHPFWITYTFYLQMYADALGAGKKLYSRGLVYRMRGIEDWSNI